MERFVIFNTKQQNEKELSQYRVPGRQTPTRLSSVNLRNSVMYKWQEKRCQREPCASVWSSLSSHSRQVSKKSPTRDMMDGAVMRMMNKRNDEEEEQQTTNSE